MKVSGEHSYRVSQVLPSPHLRYHSLRNSGIPQIMRAEQVYDPLQLSSEALKDLSAAVGESPGNLKE